VRSTAIKTVGAPIPPLAVGVISEVDATMSPELLETSNFQDDDETPKKSLGKNLDFTSRNKCLLF
jgi:hypothetical protein